MILAVSGHLSPSLPVRARAVATASVKPAIFGTSCLNCAASAVLVGTRPPSLARCNWLASELMHLTTAAALVILSLLPVSGTVHASPPSGATEVWPAVFTGNGTTPYLMPDLSSVGSC